MLLCACTGCRPHGEAGPRQQHVETGVDWLLPVDPGLAQQLAECQFKDLLPVAAWSRLVDELDIDDFTEPALQWGRVRARLRAVGQAEATPVDIQLAALFQYQMVGLVDSQLLANALRVHANSTPGCEVTNDDVIGIVSGCWDVEAHDSILGIMAKTGCVGSQLMEGKGKVRW